MATRQFRHAFVVCGVCLTAIFQNVPSLAGDIIVGTANSAQIHYNVGRAICRQYRRSHTDGACEVLRIEGRDAEEPLAVLTNVRNGTIEVGIVPSDWQYFSVSKRGPVEFMDVEFSNLRALFSLHGEPFTVVARRDSGIESINDLPGKRVNIGNPGSSQRAMMEMVMQANGWSEQTFQYVDELNAAEQFLALCHNRVQAVVINTSHPNAAIAQAAKLCDARIIDVGGAAIDKLIEQHNYLASTTIGAGTYPGGEAVATFGVKVTAVSSSDVDDDTAYEIVKTVFDNLPSIKRLHPALDNLSPDRMASDALSAPLHPGAKRHFKAAGLM